MTDVLEEMIRIAADAAVVVRQVYASPFDVDYKGPADPVTEADRLANDLICSRLEAAFPGIPVVAEESPEENWQHFRKSDRVFFVDPVDGTREFVARNGEFVVMIGLLEGDRVTRGVIHAPVQERAWAGEPESGAFEIGADGSRRALHVGDVESLDRARVTSSRSHRTALLDRALEHLNPGSLVSLGSAGLKGVAVARNVVDVYMAPGRAGCLWDSCAPEAIVRAAGGEFTDAWGANIDYRADQVENHRGVVAANPALHAAVVKRLADVLDTTMIRWPLHES